MRYLTKGWYQTMQESYFHFLVKPDERAGVFSEAFFRKAYREKEKEWLRSQRKVCRLLKRSFHEAEERKQFHGMYASRKARYEEVLPAHILSRIPDIRVLALGYCTEEIQKLLTDQSDWNRDFVAKRVDECDVAQRSSFEGADASLLDRFDFHDEEVLSFAPQDGDWVIDFGEYAGLYSQVRYLRFKNAVIQKLDGDVADARWLYEELYKTESGYELHILLDKNGLMECVLTCDDILMEGERSWC